MVTQGELCGLPTCEALRRVKAELKSAGCPDAAYDAAVLVRLATGSQREIRFDETPLTEPQAAHLAEMCRKRAGRYPLQYLAGQWDFLDFTLKVGEGVLCPRADTEVVCEAAAACVADQPRPRVLDLCAGTGCLGIGVKRLVPNAHVLCVEKSDSALEYLRQNAAVLGKDRAVEVVQGDLFGFEQTLPPEELDLIVCNPPYLTTGEMAQLQPEVAFEPAMALEAGQDGLRFYRYLAENYGRTLRPGGWLCLEIGWQQREAVTALLTENGWQNVSCKQDLGGNDRAITAQKRKTENF